MSQKMSHKPNCVTLREFVERYMKNECEICVKTIKEAIKAQNLKENDLVYPLVVYCCALTEGGSCTIPIKCPSELYHVLHCTTWFGEPIREYWCVMNMLDDKRVCYEIETNRKMHRCESEYASSVTEAIEILKRMGLSEEIARRLLQEVQ